MQMRVSSNRKSLVMLEPQEPLELSPGDLVDVTFQPVYDEHSTSTHAARRGKIVIDPRTGLPALTLGEGAPKFTSEMVAEILADFP